jgi:hypothetical protein
MAIKHLCLIMLISIWITISFSMNMVSGSYPGEIYTNNIMFNDEQNVLHYGLGYSPDYGKHFILLGTTTDQGFGAVLHGTAYPGEFYLHDTLVDCILKFHNFGTSYSIMNISIPEIDMIEPGASLNDLFLYDNTSGNSILYASTNSGSSYTEIHSFTQVTLKDIAWERTSGTLYLLGYHSATSTLRLYVSNDAGINFIEYELDAQLQSPISGTDMVRLMPAENGEIYLLWYWLSGYQREYRLYASYDNGETCELVWQYNPLMYEWIDVLWSGNMQLGFLKQSFLWYTAYNELEYSQSPCSTFSFLPVASYSFNVPYENPIYLVPTPASELLSPAGGALTLHIRSNADWQIHNDTEWVTGFSQSSGQGHQEVVMNYLNNPTTLNRTCHILFTSNAAPDTIITIIQSGYVSNYDPFVESVSIGSVYPNPFRGSMTFSPKIPFGEGTISIYNLKGQKVREHPLVRGEDIVWNGRDTQDRDVAPGVYLIRLNTKEISISQKVLKLK